MPDPSAVLAIFAHPDDIELRAAGTLLRLRDAGFAIYCLNVTSGNCGSMSLSPGDTARVRASEAREAAHILRAHLFPSLANDMEITYSIPLLRKIAACVRQANPSIVLTHALEDYMEDHMITARLAVTATFSKGMPNFATDPQRQPTPGDVTLYHAMPHGLRDPLRRPPKPDAIVDTTPVHAQKRQALAAHRSQRDWLDQTQGMDFYLTAMDEESKAVALLANADIRHAEGWNRHLHLGFSTSDQDPLADVLGNAYHPIHHP